MRRATSNIPPTWRPALPSPISRWCWSAPTKVLTRQTKRHVVILSMLGVRHIVLAVNKMDRVGWSRRRSAPSSILPRLGRFSFDDIVCIPLAAKSGDNVASRSQHMPWYRGPSLLEDLEEVEPAPDLGLDSLRMPIQWVSRPDADFRGYSGPIASGEVHVGMPVKIFLSGRVSRISRIATFDGDLACAAAGRR